MRSETEQSGSTERETPRISSSLQAILHGAGGEMETIGVPVPLPDAVIRVVRTTPPDDSSGPESYRHHFFRRVRSPDSVVRYYEDAADRIDADAHSETGSPRLCSSCGRVMNNYFVRTMPGDEELSARTAAVCSECYG